MKQQGHTGSWPGVVNRQSSEPLSRSSTPEPEAQPFRQSQPFQQAEPPQAWRAGGYASESPQASASRQGPPPRKSRFGWVLSGLFVLGVAGLTAGGTYAYHRYLPSGRSLPGTYVGGKMQPEHQSLAGWLEERRVALLDREVFLSVDGDAFPLTLGELGVELDVGKTLDRALSHAEQGRIDHRLYRAVSALKGNEEIGLVWTVDRLKLKTKLDELAPEVHLDPVDAQLDLLNYRKIPDAPGRQLAVRGSIQAIEEGPFDDGQLIELKTVEIPAQVKVDMLVDVDVTQVLGSFETSFAGTGEGREINIKRGAAYLNGTVLLPGQVLSFNDKAGERSLARGYTWAPEIFDDEMVAGVGGGICQVASTLHAAAVYGGMDIVQRRSHSRPIGYTPLGLDAVVVWGELDLKIRNPYDSPVMIHAFSPRPGVLKVELLGRAGPKVEYKYGIARAYDYYRRITTKPWMNERRVLKQRGRKGYDVQSIVKLTHPDGRVQEKVYKSAYRPVPEVFWVGPAYDVDTLPELPEGAKRVELDGKSLPTELFGAEASPSTG